MARADVIILIRKLLKRMEQEEWTLDEDLGYTTTNSDNFKVYDYTGVDTYTLKFQGPISETEIPLITIMWEDGTTSKEHWRDITGLTTEGLEAVYRYCPIKLSTIKPIKLLKEVIEVFQLNHVSTIEE